MDWQMIGVIITSMGLAGAFFNFAVIRPLQRSIDALEESIREIRNDLKDYQAQRQELAVRMSVAEDSIKNTHYRLSKLESELSNR